MRGAFPVFSAYAKNFTVATFFLFLCLNMLSAASIAQYNDWGTGRTVQGLNSVTGKRSVHQGVYRVSGGVSWRVTQNSHPNSADHKNVALYLHSPYRPSWRACGRGCGYEKDTGQRNPPSVLRHCYHDKQIKNGGSGQQTEGGRGAGKQSGVAAECWGPEM